MARYTVTFRDAGIPETGLTPTLSWVRLSDGVDPGSAPSVSELNAGVVPGVYYFEATPSERLVVRIDGGGSLADADRYHTMEIGPDDFAATATRLAALDSPFTALTGAVQASVWGATESSYSVPGSMGLLVRLIGGLVHRYHRMKAPVYDVNDRLVSCTLAVYESVMDAENDVSALGEFDVDITYDGNGNVASYLAR